jgi:hypothetical protein
MKALFAIAIAGFFILSAAVFVLPAYSQCDTTDGLCAHRPHVVIEIVSPVAIFGTVVGGAVLLLVRITDSSQT